MRGFFFVLLLFIFTAGIVGAQNNPEIGMIMKGYSHPLILDFIQEILNEAALKRIPPENIAGLLKQEESNLKLLEKLCEQKKMVSLVVMKNHFELLSARFSTDLYQQVMTQEEPHKHKKFSRLMYFFLKSSSEQSIIRVLNPEQLSLISLCVYYSESNIPYIDLLIDDLKNLRVKKADSQLMDKIISGVLKMKRVSWQEN
jgi:hypothetical protein